MLITVDTREQLPYGFREVKPHKDAIGFKIEYSALPVADYGVRREGGGEGVRWRDLAEDQKLLAALVERKSLVDLYGTLAKKHDSFALQLDRMSRYGFAAVVVEAALEQIMNPNDHLRRSTKLLPKSVVASMIAWEQRYGVHFHLCPGREVAEVITYRILERWWRDS